MFNELDETRYRGRSMIELFTRARVNIYFIKFLEKYLSTLDSFGILHLGVTNKLLSFNKRNIILFNLVL